MKTVTRILSWGGVCFFGFGAFTAIRLAVAETICREGTAEAYKRALAIQGSATSAELEERLADFDPARAHDALGEAIRANPRSSSAWIALGLAEEGANNPFAEQCLLHGAQVDHQYLPSWTLSNFYFRRANREQFWRWADRAASLTYDDFRPLLRLCDRFEPDPVRMLTHFKDARRLRPAYLDFLIGERRLDAAQTVAREMADDRGNDPHLIDLADRQLRAGNAAWAMELWNASSGFGSLDPSAGRILTNGNLAVAPQNLGFDWRLGQAQGITQKWRPSELIFNLSGAQPESCVLLEQTINLVPRDLEFRFDYMTGAAPARGVRWSLDEIEGPGIEPSEHWREGAFDLPRSSGLRHLRLLYRREPGTTRSEGQIEIRNLRLEARP